MAQVCTLVLQNDCKYIQLTILCYPLLLSGKMVKKCTSYNTEQIPHPALPVHVWFKNHFFSLVEWVLRTK